jgi:hypothetical protein
MHGEDAILFRSHETEDLLGAEQTEQDAGQYEQSDAPAIVPSLENASKVHCRYDTEDRAGRESGSNVI